MGVPSSANLLARVFACVAVVLLIALASSEPAVEIIGIAVCVGVLVGWEYWRWRGRATE
jgi:hypothetical protein